MTEIVHSPEYSEDIGTIPCLGNMPLGLPDGSVVLATQYQGCTTTHGEHSFGSFVCIALTHPVNGSAEDHPAYFAMMPHDARLLAQKLTLSADMAEPKQ